MLHKRSDRRAVCPSLVNCHDAHPALAEFLDDVVVPDRLADDDGPILP